MKKPIRAWVFEYFDQSDRIIGQVKIWEKDEHAAKVKAVQMADRQFKVVRLLGEVAA